MQCFTISCTSHNILLCNLIYASSSFATKIQPPINDMWILNMLYFYSPLSEGNCVISHKTRTKNFGQYKYQMRQIFILAKAFLCFVCFLCLITQCRECLQCVKPWAVPKPRLTCDAAGAGGKTFPPDPVAECLSWASRKWVFIKNCVLYKASHWRVLLLLNL